MDRVNRKIRPYECDLGQLKRDVRCLLIDNDDEFLYAGTTSGDILQVRVSKFLVFKVTKYYQSLNDLACFSAQSAYRFILT